MIPNVQHGVAHNPNAPPAQGPVPPMNDMPPAQAPPPPNNFPPPNNVYRGPPQPVNPQSESFNACLLETRRKYEAIAAIFFLFFAFSNSS